MRDLNAHPDFYIPFEWRKPNSEYFEFVSNIIPLTWRLKQDYFWTYAISPVTMTEKPVQGWKIHISSRWGNEYSTLEKVVPLCIAHQVEFKFASDGRILKTLLGKNCTRSASGKFITIYPANKASFNNLIEALYQVLKDEEGPYILSDRPYKDASVLFYRYGGFKGFEQKDNFNRTTACIIDNAFCYIEDKRDACFVLPDFVSDDFISTTEVLTDSREADNEPAVAQNIFNGRYDMKSVIKFSNAGGVYFAEDIHSGEEVIIKEARPYVGVDSGVDCIVRLEKEYRILTKLNGLDIAPKAYAYFREWQHVYLAQEIVAGQTLRSYQVQQSKIVHAQATDTELQDWVRNTITIAINCIKALQLLHSKQVIFGDLSLNNIMVDPETLTIKLIDFEGACEPGIDKDVNFYTPGFAKAERLARDCVDYCDDYHALGYVLVAMVMPSSTMLNLKADYADVFFRELQLDFGLPAAYLQCINYLLHDPAPELAHCVATLQAVDVSQVHALALNMNINQCQLQQDAGQLIDGVLRYNAHHLQLDRYERVLPFGPEFQQAIAVDHGVAGVAYAWNRLAGNIPAEMLSWLEHKAVSCGDALPGLLNGTSGYAWVLQELGSDTLAGRVLQQTEMNRQLYSNMSLGYGAAGYGYALLHRWQKTGQADDLARAKKIAAVLLLQAVEREGALYWEDEEQPAGVGVGLWEGGSGIALFLLYLYCATQDTQYLNAGQKALQADLTFGKDTNGSYGFPKRSNTSILYPYLGYGTAGVASVVLRYYAVTGDSQYLDFIHAVKSSVASKYTINSGLFSGVSGLGNYLLDVYDFLHDQSYYHLACQAAAALKTFVVQREEGICFPANNRTKVNTDYADGSAGTALFLQRLAEGGENFNFMSDQLIWDYLAQHSQANTQPYAKASRVAVGQAVRSDSFA